VAAHEATQAPFLHVDFRRFVRSWSRVAPKSGQTLTRHLKITTHFLTCTAPRVLRGVFAPPRVAGVHTASETFARGQVGPFLSGWEVDRLRVE